jgi:hypothetical protein
VATVREVKTHQAIMRVHERRVDVQVGWSTREGWSRQLSVSHAGRTIIKVPAFLTLNIDTPVLSVKIKGLEGSLLTEALRLINELVAAVVSSAGVTLGILVYGPC